LNWTLWFQGSRDQKTGHLAGATSTSEISLATNIEFEKLGKLFSKNNHSLLHAQIAEYLGNDESLLIKGMIDASLMVDPNDESER
jgi:hypothetical protein